MSSLSNEIIKIVENYVNQDDVKYGVMLTGEWGCGKTYFWENTLKPILEDTREEKKRKTTLYISVSGLQSSEEVSRKLMMAVLGSKSNDILSEKLQNHAQNIGEIIRPIAECTGKMIESTSQMTGLFSGLMDVKLNIESMLDFCDFSHRVICVDDVERYQGNIVEIMGFFNHLLEKRNAHIVFISNEEKLGRKYKQIKEKIIGKTVSFRVNPADILEEIIKTLHVENDKAKIFLKKNIPLILGVLKSSDRNNYRVVRMICLDFCSMYSHVESVLPDEKEKERAGKALLRFMLAAGIEVHAKGITKIQQEELYESKSSGLKELVAAVGGTGKNATSYFTDFKKRYYKELCTDRDFFPSALKYLLEGYIDEGGFREEIGNFHEAEIHPLDYVLSIGYWELSDDEFTEKIEKELLSDIEDGKIPARLYPRLFFHFSRFLNMGLIPIREDGLKRRFLRGLEKIQEAGEQEPQHPDEGKYFLEKELRKLPSETREAYEAVVESSNQTMDLLRRKKRKCNHVDFIRALREDFQEALNMASPSSEEKFIDAPLFQDVTPKDIYDVLKQKKNREIVDFRNMLIDRVYYVSKDTSDVEARFLRELSQYIRNESPNTEEMKLSDALLLQLAKYVE